jgi:hypothetical protein
MSLSLLLSLDSTYSLRPVPSPLVHPVSRPLYRSQSLGFKTGPVVEEYNLLKLLLLLLRIEQVHGLRRAISCVYV